jgi:chromosome segregation ATPase
MLGSVDNEPGSWPARRQEIDDRLSALRARLAELAERRRPAQSAQVAASERLDAAKRHSDEAHAAAAQALASGLEAFRHAAEAHERAASMHERAAAAGVGNVGGHERQAAFQRAAAAEDWRRAERAQSVLPGPERAGRASVSGEPGDGSPGTGQAR